MNWVNSDQPHKGQTAAEVKGTDTAKLLADKLPKKPELKLEPHERKVG